METMRLFIASELPLDIKRKLSSLQAEIRNRGLDELKWVEPDGIHVTLKFLGYVQPARVAAITGIIDKVCSHSNAFNVSIKGVGVFPGLSRPQVLWAGLGGETGRLGMIAERIDDGCCELGFSRERRTFKPHLTLARIRFPLRPVEQQALAETLADTALNLPLTIDAISLMQSNLTPAGAVYKCLYQAKLRLK